MKYLYILIGIIVVGFIAVQLFALSTQKNIETYSYQVEKKYDDFEIRTYEASLFTSVKLSSSDYKSSSSKGFSILAGYIFGDNKENKKIAMTSPVAMSLEDSMTMMFLVPKAYKKENLPEPNQQNIEFKEVPSKRVAAISFGGWADDEKIEKHKKALIKVLRKQGIKHSNKFYFLGYNAPYEMLNRKNDVIVELEG